MSRKGDERTRRVPAVVRALRHRNYRLFFSGQLVSLTGTWMQTVAQSWLVYRLTGSSLLLGTVGFCSQVPIFALSPFGGMVADRFDRRRVLLVTQGSMMLIAAALAALTLSGKVTVGHVMVLAALLGIASAFDIPTRQAFLSEMVPREDLLNGIALNSSVFNGARVVGPAIAGLVVAAIGEGFCFLGNAASFVAVITGLSLIRTARRAPPRGGGLAYAFEGFSYVRRTERVRAVLVLLAFASLLGTPYAVLMPIFADRVLGVGADGLGLLMGASGVGAVAGALFLARREGLGGIGTLIARASTSFGVLIALFALSKNAWLSAALLVPAGFAMMVHMAASNTAVQSMVPDHLRGRVMAVYSMVFMGTSPIGALLAGTVAQRIGAPATVAIGGGLCVVNGLLFARKLPRLRAQVS